MRDVPFWGAGAIIRPPHGGEGRPPSPGWGMGDDPRPRCDEKSRPIHFYLY